MASGYEDDSLSAPKTPSSTKKDSADGKTGDSNAANQKSQ